MYTLIHTRAIFSFALSLRTVLMKVGAIMLIYKVSIRQGSLTLPMLAFFFWGGGKPLKFVVDVIPAGTIILTRLNLQQELVRTTTVFQLSP